VVKPVSQKQIFNDGTTFSGVIKILEAGSQKQILDLLNDLAYVFEVEGNELPNSQELIKYLLNNVFKLSDDNIQKGYLEALYYGTGHCDCMDISMEIVENNLDKLSGTNLYYAIYILGNNFDEKYLSIIEKYLADPDEVVSKAAKNVLDTWG